MNHKMIWSGLIVGGIVATALGFGALSGVSTGPDETAVSAAALPVMAVLLLMTGGLLSCLTGVIGMTGLMGWIPGLDDVEPISVDNRNI